MRVSAEAPKVVKVFINLPRSMGFDDAERSEATQVLDLAEEDYKEEGLIPLRYVKFQNVQSVTVRTDTAAVTVHRASVSRHGCAGDGQEDPEELVIR